MNPIIVSLQESLERLSSTVESHGQQYNSQTLKQRYGWNHPAILPQDLWERPRRLAWRIKDASIEDIDVNMEKYLSAVPVKLDSLKNDTIPHMFNGHGVNAIPAYLDTLDTIEKILEPLLYDWVVLADNKILPPALARRLRGINCAIERLEQDAETIDGKIKIINAAHDAADTLPVDMESLREARVKIEETKQHVEQVNVAINAHSAAIETSRGIINDCTTECKKLLGQCEEAYRITTTKGLAAAFHQSANRLQITLWVWVFGLLVSLAIGAYLGHERLDLLSTELNKGTIAWGVIWMHAALSVVSLGAPIWFAWLATKQIGQRFRLSEDYAFKASVAKAYEGYRREAARIDPDFEAQLFESALTRLDEPPLRLVETDTHGSPIHEFFNSEAFKQALDKIPGLQSAYNKSINLKLTNSHPISKVITNSEDKSVL